ncbi:MAG: ATPase [Treponema sp.]|jgi:vacuolar-type H+-ATPase subunit E/Vma4|nr:ATPase [Treponema sp.]
MEELRSTEVLDKEILEDARKKAYKIIKSADDAVAVQTRRWEKKIQKAIKEIKNTYSLRTEKMKEEILARLPLDKRRIRSESSETLLKKALESFLVNLSKEELFRILEEEFAKRLANCNAGISGRPALIYRAMSEDEVSGFIKKTMARPELSNTAGCDISNWEYKNEASSAKFPALILDTPELRIIASVETAASDLLSKKRAELASSLLGEGALND